MPCEGCLSVCSPRNISRFGSMNIPHTPYSSRARISGPDRPVHHSGHISDCERGRMTGSSVSGGGIRRGFCWLLRRISCLALTGSFRQRYQEIPKTIGSQNRACRRPGGTGCMYIVLGDGSCIVFSISFNGACNPSAYSHVIQICHSGLPWSSVCLIP